MNEVPLIWTSKGNMPELDLVRKDLWEVTPEYIKHVQRHFTQDGEMVKESAYVLDLRGMASQSLVQPI